MLYFIQQHAILYNNDSLQALLSCFAFLLMGYAKVSWGLFFLNGQQSKLIKSVGLHFIQGPNI